MNSSCHRRSQELATKTVVFIGYSLTDWNFVRLYEALRSDMGAFAPAAYIVSPFDVTDQTFALTHIETSGMAFLRTLKAELIGDCLVASRCVELLQAELDCIRWPGVSADFGPGGVS